MTKFKVLTVNLGFLNSITMQQIYECYSKEEAVNFIERYEFKNMDFVILPVISTDSNGKIIE